MVAGGAPLRGIVMMTLYVSPMPKVPANLKTMGGARAKEVSGLVLFGAPPFEVELSLFFLKDNIISVGIGLITTKLKMTR